MLNEGAVYNEPELLEAIARGDGAAFRVVFDRYWGKIHAMALAYTKSAAMADDVVQDVFVKIWVKRADLPAVQKFDSYLFITGRNEIISALRKKVAHLPLESHLHESLPGDVPVPDEVLSLKESQELISRAVALLPPQQQRIYQLSRKEGLSQQEIAAQLNISVSTVKVHMNKALHTIKHYLHTNTDKGTMLWWLVLTIIAR
ncbi:RNA polymerase sigma-70 factor [Chitinophaga horti]|uniref:RNA polymerase sigma-70 factor n=1 Tax=Chitinophaga horti TaxID=2920382 RepID=A0ABY6J8N7_9BACT|nr:RNA polymerase sigma-70 factor [Chitinophaga horti]UYQ95967.1 RNA polymerase sigma-70 factor [Chitinophaga horti]